MRQPEKYTVSWGPVTAVLGSILLFFGSQILVGLLAAAMLAFMGWDEARIESWLSGGNKQQFLLSSLVAFVTIVLLFWYLALKKVYPKDIGLVKPHPRDILSIISGAVTYILAYVSLVTVMSGIIPSLDTEQTQELGFTATGASDELVLIFISLVVLPPLIEEIVVRGFMFSGLRTKLKFWSAAMISSSIFGLAHLLGGEGGSAIWIAVIDTFILGMVLAYLREKTGSLWPAIGLHALKNFVAFTFLFVLST